MTPRARTAAAVAVGLATLLAACATTPEALLTVDDVIAERIAEQEAVGRADFDTFLAQSGGRLDELGLPVPAFQGLVPVDDWGAAVTACIERLDPQVEVSRLEGGFSINYFGVVGESYERMRWTVESCSAQYGVVDRVAGVSAGVVEAAWRYHDATHRVIPCLRGIDAPVPTPPSAVAFVEHLGTGREWSPYALASLDPAVLLRAVSLCPPSSTLIAARLAQRDDAAIEVAP